MPCLPYVLSANVMKSELVMPDPAQLTVHEGAIQTGDHAQGRTDVVEASLSKTGPQHHANTRAAGARLNNVGGVFLGSNRLDAELWATLVLTPKDDEYGCDEPNRAIVLLEEVVVDRRDGAVCRVEVSPMQSLAELTALEAWIDGTSLHARYRSIYDLLLDEARALQAAGISRLSGGPRIATPPHQTRRDFQECAFSLG